MTKFHQPYVKVQKDKLLIEGDAVTTTAAELNALDGATASAAELNILDGVTATTAELNYNDITAAGTSEASKAMVRDANNEMDGVPVAESQAVDLSQKSTMAVDFHGDLVDGTTLLLKGEGSGTGNAVALSAGEGGRLSILTASDDGAHSANGSGVSGSSLNWRADSGGLVLETRLQVDDITQVLIFAGFTDAVASTVEAPIFLVAGDIDSDADNACGIGFDTDGTTDEFFHGGVKATTDTVPAFSGSAPVNATYVTLRVEVSAAGGVRGYIDGTAIGVEVANAVTATSALTPVIFVANRSAAARIVLVDYLWVQSDR